MWLVIDTTTKQALLALIDDMDSAVIERRFDHKTTQKVIFSELATILDPDTLAQLDGIAVGIGPGSFTGVKIGVMAAKALAWSREISLSGVGSLDVVAAGMDVTAADFKHLAVAVQSTRGEIYLRIYYAVGGVWRPYGPEHDVPLDVDVLKKLLPKTCLIISGEAAELLADKISHIMDVKIADKEFHHPTARGFIRLAGPKLETSEVASPLTLQPLYIRPSQPQRLEEANG